MNAPFVPADDFRNPFLDAIDPASRAYDEFVRAANRFDGSYEIARDRLHAIIREMGAPSAEMKRDVLHEGEGL